MKKLLVTFPNQQKHLPRIFSLAAFDINSFEAAHPRWVRNGATAKDLGVCGVWQVGEWLYCLVQSKTKPRVTSLDLQTWQIRHTYVSQHISDPHSVVEKDGALYVTSSGNNAVVRLQVEDGRVLDERVFWRVPDTTATNDDVHLNSLAFVNGSLMVTAFGPRGADGKWTQNGYIYDTTHERFVFEGIAHPHSLIEKDGTLYVAGSYHVVVHIGTPGDSGYEFETVEVGGYTRGLAVTGGDLLVGVSAKRKVSKSTGKINDVDPNAGARCGIMRIDLKSRAVSRCKDLADFGEEIYDLQMIEAGLPEKKVAPSRLRMVEACRSWRDCR